MPTGIGCACAANTAPDISEGSTQNSITSDTPRGTTMAHRITIHRRRSGIFHGMLGYGWVCYPCIQASREIGMSRPAAVFEYDLHKHFFHP
jgi:hypothetical protein